MKSVFVGETTLVMRCASVILEQGHDVRAVVTRDAQVSDWANERGLTVFDKDDFLQGKLDREALDCDVLFSVANLDMLPRKLLDTSTLALNFHDGPLPRYAGLNAASWAIINREASHGVTWHVMEDGPDTGSIAVQKCFDIDPDETANSLNAKCYEAGFDCFCSLVRQLEEGRLELRPQKGTRTYNGRDARPNRYGLIDFSSDTAGIVALVRGLDLGQYANPLGPAKISADGKVICVTKAEVGTAVDAGPPGRILEVNGDRLVVACRQGSVILGGLFSGDGTPLSAGEVMELSRHGQLIDLSEHDEGQLDEIGKAVAQAEGRWVRRLLETEPNRLPYANRIPESGEERALPVVWRVREMQVDLPDQAQQVAHIFGALVSWMHQLTGVGSVAVRSYNSTSCAQGERFAGLFLPWRLARVDVTSNEAKSSVVAKATDELASLEDMGGIATDLAIRVGKLERRAVLAGRPRIGFAHCDVARLPHYGFDDLDLLLISAPSGHVGCWVRASTYSDDVAELIGRHLEAWIAQFATASGSRIGDLTLLPDEEHICFESINAVTAMDEGSDLLSSGTIISRFREQVIRTPERIVLRQHEQALSYTDLESRSNKVANYLRACGVHSGAVIGVCLGHSPDMVAAILGILKTGAAYLPLDPDYPAGRLAFMLKDSNSELVIVDGTASRHAASLVDAVDISDCLAVSDAVSVDGEAEHDLRPEGIAYLIYTSGSTGQPKGVQITHANVVNFFDGMDQRVRIANPDDPGTWLSVTSINFDISVLEILWTLTRGFTIAMHAKLQAARTGRVPREDVADCAVAFSLFYFANGGNEHDEDPYRLLLEGARFADREGFEAVWTPERHFHAFGGLYPNPAVTSSAIAAVTERVKIRAGSCVAPLHHPARIVEDWSVIDNISKGRVGLALAAGWNPNDFVLRPQAFQNAKQLTLDAADQISRLWEGEAIAFANGLGEMVETRTLPRPVQKVLPIWLTAARNPQTFAEAGKRGYNVLTHLLGMTLDDVAENIQIYRRAWCEAGHPGEGRVTLMLHTYVGDDRERVREIVRGPMKTYLSDALDLVKAAAWSFPTIRDKAEQSGRSISDVFDAQELNEEEQDALLEHAFNRYFEANALFGTSESCLEMVEKVNAIGVDEIACLIDFGIDTKTALAGLPSLKALMDQSRTIGAAVVSGQDSTSVVDDLISYGATHLQCTPSMAAMLVEDPASKRALGQLEGMLVGGEAFPVELARRLRQLVPGQLLNMYGPTETTIWSMIAEIDEVDEAVEIGKPIANTQLMVMSPAGAVCPAMVAGELLIGGRGVSPGYWQRPELNRHRFVEVGGKTFFRTGDLVRRTCEGRVDFLGRIDHQIKIRGHRIELGEVQCAIENLSGVARAVVVAAGRNDGEKHLVGYLTLKAGASINDKLCIDELAKVLPDIMVPRVLVTLRQFPMTPNGKVDKKALPQPMPLSTAVEQTPVNETEQKIADIWCSLIGLDQVDTRANFFEVGGHSLLAVQVQRQIREELQAAVSITDMFRYPTIRQLADRIGDEEKTDQRKAVERGTARAQRRLTSRGSRRVEQAN